MLADTHCHLNFDTFDDDREEVLARAREAGVERILNPGVDLASSRKVIHLAEIYPEVFAAVGVHPNDLNTWDESILDELWELVKHPKVVAVGEIGLDYYWERTAHEVQQQCFRQQLELAANAGLPVVIHTRNSNAEDSQATTDVLNILSEWHTQLARMGSPLVERPGVLHSYRGDEAAAQQAIQLNFRIGITGPVTYRNAPDLQNVVTSLGLEHLLVETDAPFLTPHPYRGKRNEPAYVRLVAEKIAQIHNLPLDLIARVTTAGAERLFHW